MLNYKIRYNNKDNNIIIPLNKDLDFIGDENFVDESDLIIKDFIDNEITKYILSDDVNLIFNFFNNSYQTNFESAGFTNNDINLSSKGYRYSYVMFQVYDNFKGSNQTLLHNGFIPLYLFPDKTISEFDIKPNVKYYEFNNLYISNNYPIVDNQVLYVNFKFYNAKTGKLQIFFNQTINSTSEERLYFKLIINKEHKTYKFNNLTISAFQFLNEAFIDKINEKNKNENKSPIFTTGDLFDINGKYI